MNTQKGFAPILIILLGLVVIGGGGYLYMNKSSQVSTIMENEDISTPDEQTNTDETQVTISEEVTKKEELNEISENTVTTAYLVSIENNKITLDYFDSLWGEAAVKAIIEDGLCTAEQINNGCFPNGQYYDRNINPKLRTFELAKDVKISTAYPVGPERATNVTIDALKSAYIRRDENGNPSSPPFTVTIKDNVVTSISEIYRP